MRKVIFLLFCALTSTSIFFACQKDTNFGQSDNVIQEQSATQRTEIGLEVDN